jgi:Ca-activated chloride channel family protein
MLAMAPPPPPSGSWQPAHTAKYAAHADNPVHRASEEPVSTFSIDVDTGSYANVRRMLREGTRPPADAVRAEEMLNYFRYGHPAPTSRDTPFRVTTELAPAPWNAKHQLLMIGIKGYELSQASLPPANLVFLIDTSGSMDSPDKLPLLKQAFTQLVRQLRPQDRVSIVVYAGSAGLVLAPTPGDRQGEILAALDRLQAGGSTNGGDGIRLAYAMAKQAFVKGGANRVILATDGDFNVGTVDQGALETLVADQRKSGIALTTLGFGEGNYNDQMAERLADVGDGNHAYIDSVAEARKVLVRQMGATLVTIAKDVKIQVEFNPAQVAEYRLIGYENRALRREDFANDKVDAGDIGAGHEVTALYELVPAGSGAGQLPPLRYGGSTAAASGANSNEIADLRLRYKRPGEDASRLIDTPVLASSLRGQPSPTLRFAATVAAYADALRGGTHLGDWTWNDIARNARSSANGGDERVEFAGLVDAARALTGDAPATPDIAGND